MMSQIQRCCGSEDGAIFPAQDYPVHLRPARKISPKAILINPLLTQPVWPRWLNIDLAICKLMDLRTRRNIQSS